MKPAPRLTGFTLVEMLVAVAVLVLLLIGVAQIVNDAQKMSTASAHELGADAESRTVFDRMATDLSRMVHRPDVDYLFNHPQAVNDSFFFYSEAPAFSTAATAQQNSVALVGYRINPQWELDRLGDGLAWNADSTTGGMVFLTYSDPPLTPFSTPLPASTISGAFPTVVASTSTDSNYHTLAADVFRLEICYLLKPCLDASGTQQPAIYSNLPYDTRLNHASTTGIGFSDVQAVVASIALMDAASRKMVPAGFNYTGLANLLAAPTDGELSATPPLLMAAKWQGVLDAGTFAAASGLPRAVAGQVRVYQRVIPINSP